MTTLFHEQKSSRQIWRLLGVAVLLNALFSTAIILSVTPSDIWFSNIKTTLFLPASLLAHFSFLFFLLALIPLLAYQLRLRGKSWHLITLILFTTLLLIVIVDSRVFSLYRFHLNSMSLNLLFGGAAGNILSFSSSMWGSIITIVLGIIVIEFFFLQWLFKQALYSGKRVWQFILFLMVSTQLTYGYQDAIADTTITMQLRYIPWAQPLTMKRSLRKLGIIDNISSNPSLHVKKHSALNYPISPLSCQNSEKFNYLILMVDSARADVLNAEVMPNTFAFSQSAITFNQHWSTSNSTRFGLFGFFYGIPSTYWFDMLKEQRGSVLFDQLKEQDYTFHIDAAAPLNSPEFDRTIFSEVRSSLQWVKGENALEDDTIVINRLLAFLDQDHRKNFFAFNFLDAPHGYKLPEGEQAHFQPALTEVNYLELDNDYDPEPFLNLYKSTVYYNDRLLGQVYKKLAERDLLKNTIVIITSDHGQEFNDLKQNYWGHNSNFSEYQVKVPLVIHWPGKSAQQISYLTSHEDIIPSLLGNALGCTNDISDYSTGYSLFNSKRPENRNLLLSNWSSRAIYTGDTFYNFPVAGSMEILDNRYRPKKNPSDGNPVIQENLLKMSQYLK